MKEIIEKLSSYNIFNYLLPGALFAVFIEKITPYKIIHHDILTSFFIYYFAGMAISRLGSLIIEPIAKYIKFVKFSTYTDFLSASENDSKLEILSETNNTYRTLCSLFIILALTKFYVSLSTKFAIPQNTLVYILIVVLFLLFICAYRKQTKYILKRVEINKNEHR